MHCIHCMRCVVWKFCSLLVQEWEAFTGLIVSDTKHESGKDIPNWIEPDRTPAIHLLKVIHWFYIYSLQSGLRGVHLSIITLSIVDFLLIDSHSFHYVGMHATYCFCLSYVIISGWCRAGKAIIIYFWRLTFDGCSVCVQTTFPQLYQELQLQDSGLWSAYSRSSQCEQQLPSSVCRKLTAFQQLLVVQATRPDRLQSAMSQFASTALGTYSLSVTRARLILELEKPMGLL